MKVTTPTPDHNAVFSDIVKHGLNGSLHAAADILKDDNGNPVVSADLGPIEVSAYISADDNSLVVQIDCESLMTVEQSELRVYLNNATIYPELDNTHTIKIEGAN